ncbi:MAG: cysteine desulfurase [Verrucomicrobia bacterium]|nr:cysteine desulfurase [Verrucomicrobiota bacterium]MDA0725340.1 cysteine desulfurase [Verrucomicrobiota bacterium]MDA1047413.1 cysteine desulfurase [Verrucomicrobiota bacterium]
MTTSFDPETVRRDFPILGKSFRGKPLAYLDNAATSQKPNGVIDAIANHYRKSNANVHRGVYALAEEAETAYVHARKVIADHLNVEADEIIFVRGTTEALNLVAQSHARTHLGEGDVVVLTTMEHHANIVPWQLVKKQTGIEIEVVPILEDGSLDRDALSSLLDQPKVKLLSLCHVSNSLGTVNPVSAIVAEAKESGVVTVIDGAQSIPHGPIDLRDIDCDFFAFSGHKVFGPMGIGVLYGKRELLADMPPYQGGGDMIDEVTFEETTFAPPPQRFEAGTPNVEGAIGLGAAIEYLGTLDLVAAAAHENALLEHATTGMEALPGLTIHGHAPGKAAVISFTVDGIHPHDIATFLDAEGIAIRTGHHCCQPLMKHLGLTATARASFAFYNTTEEVDRLVEALQKTIACFQ